MTEALGRWFNRQQENSKSWLVVLVIFLALLLAANFAFHPLGGSHGGGNGDGHAQVADTHGTGHEAPAPAHSTEAEAETGHGDGGYNFWAEPPAHFGPDQYPGFFAAFGFFGAVLMVFFVKQIVQPVIEVEEDPDDV